MPSQFFGLNIAYTGLLASNAALNTTNNNIANSQTPGFSRQQVSQQASNALRVFQTYGCAGAGVDTLAIERVRDQFYDFRYWNNNQRVGEYSQKQYYMQQIQTYFDDNGKNAGFKTVFNNMMISGLQELMKNPDDTPNKKQFIGTAGALAEYFNGVAGNLQKLQKDVNQEIKVKVDEINSLASEIASLNKQINTIELSGAGMKANELRDRRELLIDQLSEIVDVEVQEVPILDNNDMSRVTGANRYIVRIAGNQILVDGNDYNGLECKARASYEKVNQSDVDGLYDVYWKSGQKFNLYNGAMGGALKGLVDMRDGNNGESFQGEITEIGTVTDGTTVRDTVTIEVGLHYLTDLNRCNLSDQGGVINLGGREYYYDSWEYSVTYDAAGNPSYSYTFTLSDSTLNGTQKLTNDRVGKMASIGTSVSYQGVPYYMQQMNEWVRNFSQKFNDILKNGVAGDEPGINMFTADMATKNDQYVFENHTDETLEEYFARVENLRKLDPTLTEEEARLQALGDYRYDKESKKAFDDRVNKLTAVRTASDGSQVPSNITAAEAAEAATLKISVGKNDTIDSYYLLTAVNFAVNNTLEVDPDRLATRSKDHASDGVEQNDLLEELNDLATDKDKMSFRGSSASEFLQCILSDVALNASRAETFYKSFIDIAYTVDTQRLSISGVDEDEEAVNLVRYQQGYNLACQMIQTLSEIYDRLILQTGV